MRSSVNSTSRKTPTARPAALSPEQYIAETEALFSDLNAAWTLAVAKAKALVDQRPEPRGLTAMREGRRPFSREVEAWEELQTLQDASFADVNRGTAIRSQEELNRIWADANTRARRLKMATATAKLIDKMERKLWKEVAAEVGRARGKAMIAGDVDPWAASARAIDALCTSHPDRVDFKRLRELLAQERSRLAPSVLEHPIEAMRALKAARGRMMNDQFQNIALATIVSKSNGEPFEAVLQAVESIPRIAADLEVA